MGSAHEDAVCICTAQILKNVRLLGALVRSHVAELSGGCLILSKGFNHFLSNQVFFLSCGGGALLRSFSLLRGEEHSVVSDQVEAYLVNALLQVERTEAFGDRTRVAVRLLKLLSFLLVNGGPNLVVLREKAELGGLGIGG